MRFIALVFATTCFLSGSVANAQQTVRPCTTTADQTNCLPVAAAQPLPVTVVGAQGGQTSVLFTNTGANTWTVPSGVTLVYVDGCGAGGPGGGGGATVSAAGGGGGGGAQCVSGYPLNVTPGSTLTITVPAAATGGAANSTGSTGGNLTITGENNPFPVLGGGGAGVGTTGATGGAGGSGGCGGTFGATAGGGGGGAAGVAGGVPSPVGSAFYTCGPGGGGGGSTASAGARGGNAGPFLIGTAQASNASGGGGANSLFSNGGVGGTITPTAGSAPTIGYGGGGGGGGPSNTATGAGGNGAQGFAQIRY